MEEYMKSKKDITNIDDTGGIVLDYRPFSKQKLYEYNSLKCAVKNISERIQELKLMQTALSKGIIRERVQGGKASSSEDQKLSIICELDRLQTILKIRSSDLRRIDRALNSLTKEQQTILRYFYIDAYDNHIERLMQDLCMERRTVYYKHDAALRDFTIAMYGVCDF